MIEEDVAVVEGEEQREEEGNSAPRRLLSPTEQPCRVSHLGSSSPTVMNRSSRTTQDSSLAISLELAN
jgi:hypothetical protein